MDELGTLGEAKGYTLTILHLMKKTADCFDRVGYPHKIPALVSIFTEEVVETLKYPESKEAQG